MKIGVDFSDISVEVFLDCSEFKFHFFGSVEGAICGSNENEFVGDLENGG